MKLDPEILQQILFKGDARACVSFFTGATELQRAALAPMVVKMHKLCRQAYAASSHYKPKPWPNELPKDLDLDGFGTAVRHAMLAAVSQNQWQESKGYLDHLEWEFEVLTDRRPPWLQRWVEEAFDRQQFSWNLLHRLVSAGVCAKPASDRYIAVMVEAFYEWDYAKKLKAFLKENPSLLKEDIWRIFEVESCLGGVYAKDCPWSVALASLAKEGLISRERLLEACLPALQRDFSPKCARWFAWFYDYLKPTLKERVAHQAIYLRLLGSRVPTTVAFAFDALQLTDPKKPVTSTQLEAHWEPVLLAPQKQTVVEALRWLKTVVEREPAFAPKAACLACHALLHEAPEIQKKSLDFIERCGTPDSPVLQEKLGRIASHVAPSLRRRILALIKAPPVASTPRAAESAFTPKPIPARLAPERALKPVVALEELIQRASAFLETPTNPDEAELVLAGICRFNAERPAGFASLTGPLHKHCLKKAACESYILPRFSPLERMLALTLLTWMDGKDHFPKKLSSLYHDFREDHMAFLCRRFQAVNQRLANGQNLTLLAVPTHQGAWIAPTTLVQRWQTWQKAGQEPDRHEQVLALLRLAPEGRAEALPAAKSLQSQGGEALRFALGEKLPPGRDASLWLAAWRSRQPVGDLPEFEKIHPNLGPDAGTAAKYEYLVEWAKIRGDRQSWNQLYLPLTVKPAAPKQVDSCLAPVLIHRGWDMDEECKFRNFLRYSATVWPANLEPFLATGVSELANFVNYQQIGEQMHCVFLELLSQPHTAMRPMASLILALGLAAHDTEPRGLAQDALIATIEEDRLDVPLLGSLMSQLLQSGSARLMRWSKALGEAAQVSSRHCQTVIQLVGLALQGKPANVTPDISVLLELYYELLMETGLKITDPHTIQFLQGVTTGGRTGKLSKQLLELTTASSLPGKA
jgi:hypothetical protein